MFKCWFWSCILLMYLGKQQSMVCVYWLILQVPKASQAKPGRDQRPELPPTLITSTFLPTGDGDFLSGSGTHCARMFAPTYTFLQGLTVFNSVVLQCKEGWPMAGLLWHKVKCLEKRKTKFTHFCLISLLTDTIGSEIRGLQNRKQALFELWAVLLRMHI